MIEQKIRNISGALSRSSIFLSRSLLESNRIERNLEKRSLVLKRKIVEERGRTLKNLESRDKGTQKGGVLGGALGLLGLGGGGGLLRRGLRRTPKSPSQLLRMQKGTSNLSRVGRFGRLARPLAAVGTGLDFVGRRAEGQSNVQAGVGAAGGLAGSLAGAKAGAFFGSFAGPVGTIVGGAGGAIIGSLAGGRIADLFTGANRRRQFEEERVILRSQKTLFSEALDDFDKVLDKFEDVAPALVLRRGDDDEEEGAAGSIRPPLPTPFFKRPAVKKTGQVLTVAALLSLLALSARRGKVDPKTYNKILEKVIANRPFLRKLSEKEQVAAIGKIIERSLPKSAQQRVRMNASPFLDKLGRFTPGKKGAPGISLKGKEVRNLTKAERKELFEERANLRFQRFIKRMQKRKKEDDDMLKNIEKDPEFEKIKRQVVRESGERVDLDPTQRIQRASIVAKKARDFLREATNNGKKPITDVIADQYNARIIREITPLIKELKVLKDTFKKAPKPSTKIRIDDTESAIKILRDANEFIIKQLKTKFQRDISSNNLEPSSDTLALAPEGNIFLLGGNKNEQRTTSQPVINLDGGGTTVATNPFDAVAANLLFESTLTT